MKSNKQIYTKLIRGLEEIKDSEAEACCGGFTSSSNFRVVAIGGDGGNGGSVTSNSSSVVGQPGAPGLPGIAIGSTTIAQPGESGLPGTDFGGGAGGNGGSAVAVGRIVNTGNSGTAPDLSGIFSFLSNRNFF